MWFFGRKAQINKIDTFSFDDSGWLAGESITSLTVTQEGDLVEILDISTAGTVVTARLRGLIPGSAKLRYSIDTATRSHYIDGTVTVSPN